MTKEEAKWKVSSHSYQIADTGDYDGHWEISKGDFALTTKEDGDEIEIELQKVADLLNYLNLLPDDKHKIDLYISESRNKELQSETASLKEENERLRKALNAISEWKLPDTGKFWDKEKKEPMSYSAAWGSNGARDYFKHLAYCALSNIEFKDPYDFTKVKLTQMPPTAR